MAPGENLVGKIHSIACRDFVTYDNIIIHPGPYFNIITGCNGTGKSTLVAAIILGMGGEPKLLSRSSDIKHYVKNGKREAWIEIKIYSSALALEKFSFERSFDLTGKSKWKVNGKQLSGKEYLREVKKFNIQIGNLCQFLPQDRVQDFSSMNPQQILQNTQLSVCESDIVKKFEDLKELRNQQLNWKKGLQENETKLKDLEQKFTALNDVIERIRTKKRYMVQLDICNMKKEWLEYTNLKKKAEEIKEDLRRAKEKFEKEKKKHDKITKKTKSIFQLSNELKEAIKKGESQMEELYKKLNTVIENCERVESSINEKKIEFEAREREETRRRKELINETKLLSDIIETIKKEKSANENDSVKVNELNEAGTIIKDEIRRLNQEHASRNQQLDECRPELEALKRQIENIQSIKERRLKMLQNHFQDVYEGVRWLRANEHIFEGHVYEPMLLELRIKGTNNAKYLENTVSNRDLIAFTCTRKSDVSLLIQKLRTEKGLSINVLYSEEASTCKYRAREPITNLTKYGFHSYLLDLVEGPAPLLNYLCRSYRIESILVGSDAVNNNTDRIPKHISLYFTPNFRYQTLISRYTQDVSSVRNPISSRNLFCVDVNAQESGELQKRYDEVVRRSDNIRNERSEIERRISVKEEELNSILQQRKVFDIKQEKEKKMKNELILRKKIIDKLKNKTFDLNKAKEEMNKFTYEAVSKLLQLQKKKCELLDEYQKGVIDNEFNKAKLNIHQRENVNSENLLKKAEKSLKEARDIATNVMNTLVECKDKYQQILNGIKNKNNGQSPEDVNFPLRHEFNKLPDNSEELDGKIDDITSRIECIGADNQGAVQEYEETKESIAKSKQSIESILKNRDSTMENMRSIHNEWISKINEVIEHINLNFSRYMQVMEYAGEIKLIRSDDEFDYDSYGIQILVQYRNDMKLQPLDRLRQSGGEQAVAIATYTLSLQHITNVPFRCVDEINQGMDPKNERKVFDLLVETTCKKGNSQYFFITPKLLPNFKTHELMEIHIVFNGKHIENYNVFNC